MIALYTFVLLVQGVQGRNSNQRTTGAGILQLWAIKVLNSLAMYQPTHALIVANNGLNTVTRTIDQFASTRGIKVVGQELLDTLATGIKLGAGGSDQAHSTPTLPRLARLTAADA